MTTKTEDEVELRFYRRSDAVGVPPEVGTKALPCKTDAQREHIADLVEQGTWSFIGPPPEWHDTKPLTLRVSGGGGWRQVWIDGRTVAFGDGGRHFHSGEEFTVRTDSPPARAFAEHLLATSCELVGPLIYRWLAKALDRAAEVRADDAPLLQVTTPLRKRKNPQIVERRSDGSVGLTRQRVDPPKQAARGSLPAPTWAAGGGQLVHRLPATQHGGR